MPQPPPVVGGPTVALGWLLGREEWALRCYNSRMDTAERIVVQPDLMLGQPCIRGTRLPVYVVVEAIATGASQQELMAEYPFLESEDIAAALVYAARLAQVGIEVA